MENLKPVLMDNSYICTQQILGKFGKSNNIPLECVNANPCGAFKACIPMVNSFKKCFFPCSRPLSFSLPVILHYGPRGTRCEYNTLSFILHRKVNPTLSLIKPVLVFPFRCLTPVGSWGPCSRLTGHGPGEGSTPAALVSHFWLAFVFFFFSDGLSTAPSQKADSHDTIKDAKKQRGTFYMFLCFLSKLEMRTPSFPTTVQFPF